MVTQNRTVKQKGRGRGWIGNRFAMWRALRAPAAKGFVSQPEPRSIGLYARGKQLLAGNFQFAGQLIEAPAQSLWDITSDDPEFWPEFWDEAHGFAWLDDLAAVGDLNAKARAQAWVWDWMGRYGRGQGAGWTPDLTGRRLIRWINHALFLLSGRDQAQSALYYRLVSAQVVFLSRRWPHAAPGLPRFEALTGLISGGLALIGMEAYVGPAIAALAEECAREIDAQGGIPTRNPEELLDVFTLLTWAEHALAEAGRLAPPALSDALERIAPTLRALRHADGGLARFHSGGRGMEGRLDQALSVSGVKPAAVVPAGASDAQGSSHGAPRLAMGFARLSGGRSTIVVDASAPPSGAAGLYAHASTLAFELTSGRRPVVVSCGSGAPFGADWRRAGRATPSHSTLGIEGYSSSRLGAGASRDVLADRAQVTLLQQTHLLDVHHLELAHNGWSATHGLTHHRSLTLSADGRRLTGSDALHAQTQAEQDRFEQLLTMGKMEGVAFSVRFHLHPDVDAHLDMGGTAVSLALKSGEIWVFRHDKQATLSLDASVFLEKGRLKPRPSRQIVLSWRARAVETKLGWTLAKAQDTPLAIRDLDRDDMPVPI